MEVLDESPVNINKSGVVYGGFWARLGAILLDGLILSPLTILVLFFNILLWKSIPVFIILNLVSLCYKPLLEFKYGATLGKMALGLKVVDLQFEKASIEQILLRNIFHIVPTLVSIVFSLAMYTDPEFQNIDGFIEYTTYSQQFTSMSIISFISGGITIVDAIMLIADDQKRSLHDRIGKTYVIQPII